MKKVLSIFLAALLTLSLAACSGKENQDPTPSSGSPDASNTKEPNKEPDKDQGSVKNALELLTKVWSTYEDDEKFPAAGGDMSEENMTMDAPGKFGIDDAAALDATLGLPESSVGKIDDAASLVHMMNANTFTCGAYHAASGTDTSELTDAIRDNILQRQWMCGFPDRLVIVELDGYIVSFFGAEDIVDGFLAKLSTAYPAASKVCDQPITP